LTRNSFVITDLLLGEHGDQTYMFHICGIFYLTSERCLHKFWLYL